MAFLFFVMTLRFREILPVPYDVTEFNDLLSRVSIVAVLHHKATYKGYVLRSRGLRYWATLPQPQVHALELGPKYARLEPLLPVNV